MTSTAVVPEVAALRRRLRKTRRAHHRRPLGQLLNDLYLLLWVFGVYGGMLGTAAARHLHARGASVPAATLWLLVAALLVAGGMAWRLLRMVGPVLVGPAERTWVVSSPVDRARWLAPRVVLLLLGLALGGALTATVAGVVVRSATVVWGALAGAAAAAALGAAAVAAQRGGASAWGGAPAALLAGAGMTVAAGVVAVGRSGAVLAPPPAGGTVVLAALGVPLAAIAVAWSWRALGALDAAALGAGAQVASAGMTAAVGLDLSLLFDVLEVRRWRRVGSVRSRPFHTWRRAPSLVLLEAELRRLGRRPDALAVWASAALAQYALAIAVPGAAPVLRPVLAYLVGNRLTAGLRTLARARGLARGLAVSESSLRALHIVVPALAVMLWWAVTAPAGGDGLGRGDLAWIGGVVGSVYRAATRPPMAYDGMAVETPFGLFPMDLLRQAVRGPDLLGATILARMLLRG